MKVLIADKFEESGVQELRELGCQVIYDPKQPSYSEIPGVRFKIIPSEEGFFDLFVQAARNNREWLSTVTILALSSVLVAALFGAILGAPAAALAGTDTRQDRLHFGLNDRVAGERPGAPQVHHAVCLEHHEVLGRHRLRDARFLREHAYRELAFADQALEDRAPGRIG